MNKKATSAISNIGWYQIIGGAIGIFPALYTYFTEAVTGLNLVLLVAILFFYSYSVFCGILCLKRNSVALTLSLVNQILQILAFAFNGFSFAYVSGIYFSLGLDLSISEDIKLGIGVSRFDFTYRQEFDQLFIKINVIALLIIYWIAKIKRTLSPGY